MSTNKTLFEFPIKTFVKAFEQVKEPLKREYYNFNCCYQTVLGFNACTFEHLSGMSAERIMNEKKEKKIIMLKHENLQELTNFIFKFKMYCWKLFVSYKIYYKLRLKK